jgi:hypothetical protein
MCGATFNVGGNTGIPRHQRFCSPQCAIQARHTTPAAASLTEAPLAYLAGLFDSVGRIALYTRGATIAVRIRVKAPTRTVASWLMTTTGVGHLHGNRVSTWNWWCSGGAASLLLQQMRPHLVAQRAQADLACSVQERLNDPAHRGDAIWLAQVREQMRSLNTHPTAD